MGYCKWAYPGLDQQSTDGEGWGSVDWSSAKRQQYGYLERWWDDGDGGENDCESVHGSGHEHVRESESGS